MSVLEVRRHSDRKGTGGSQLSQVGVDRARRLGATMGPFASVTTSVLPRSRETAIAMGFAVDHEVVTLVNDPDLFGEMKAAAEQPWWTDLQPFAALARALKHDGAYWRYASSMAGLWRDLLTPLGPDDRALFIGHSGELEAALVAAFPSADHTTWGGLFGPCEGARLHFEGEPSTYAEVELLRG